MEKAAETLRRLADATSRTSTSRGPTPPGPTPPEVPPHLPGPGRPDCPNCQGLGYVSADVPVEDHNFGKLFACSCRLEEIGNVQASQRRHLSSLGVLHVKTFEKFLPEGHALYTHQRESLRRAYDRTCQFAEAPRGWLLLHGGYGCGKTHLAAAIANYCLTAGTPVIFVNVPDLLDHLRATFSPASNVEYDELFEQVRNVSLLVLDDLGAESPTQWAQEKLYQITNHRYNAQLPTVITSNVELERIEPRIRSRLVDMDLVRKVVIDAPDFRRAESDQTDLSSLALHSHQTFEAFDLRQSEIAGDHFKGLQTAFEIARDFAEDPQGWLVFTGGPSCGKTHLAAAIANYRTYNGQPALFITVVGLLDHLRATFSPDSLVRYDKRFSEVRTAPLLVLDDLALESATPWAKEKLMQLVDYRYVAALPTVITSPLYRKEIAAVDPRLEARLFDAALGDFCPISAPPYKGKRKRRHWRARGRL